MAFTFSDIIQKYFPPEFGDAVYVDARQHASGHLAAVCPYCGEFLKYTGDKRAGPDDMYCRSCGACVWWVWNEDLGTYESFGWRGAEE